MNAELKEIYREFAWELIREDFRNRTYIDYLEAFLDTSLIDQQSFCMSDHTELQLRKGLSSGNGICYTINGQEGLFDENK